MRVKHLSCKKTYQFSILHRVFFIQIYAYMYVMCMYLFISFFLLSVSLSFSLSRSLSLSFALSLSLLYIHSTQYFNNFLIKFCNLFLFFIACMFYNDRTLCPFYIIQSIKLLYAPLTRKKKLAIGNSGKTGIFLNDLRYFFSISPCVLPSFFRLAVMRFITIVKDQHILYIYIYIYLSLFHILYYIYIILSLIIKFSIGARLII